MYSDPLFWQILEKQSPSDYADLMYINKPLNLGRTLIKFNLLLWHVFLIYNRFQQI
ncbi:hypothetical protein C7972_1079 [Arenibacter sp. ARW7G5Y1]|nr:hypothetical protein C7972_1079 [Arenibacter sp. ARW7G5Y1]